MDNAEADRSSTSLEEAGHLNRNRSFKSKQLVRSQAIRESQSPPRTVSPAVPDNDINIKNNSDTRTLSVTENVSDDSSHVSDCVDVSYSDKNNYSDEFKKQQPVEIQITPGAWDEQQTEQRQRTKRWLGHKHHSDSSRDLLSNNPRVACVCGACAACPHCRGRRRRHVCPTKQDSGIVCSDDCPDCLDTEQNGTPNTDGIRKSDTVEIDDQTYYCRCPERKETKPKNLSLSRTDSEEKTEPTGVELVNFIKETLNKNARDRMTLLKIEKELHSLVNDTGRCIVRFPVMTSYGRMLVHRCAALFQLSHHLDQANRTCVLVSKSGTSGGRLPCTSFREWCTSTFPPSPQTCHGDTHAKSILKRDAQSLEEAGGGRLAGGRSKSLEQRERDYERVRRRIFSTDNCSQDESQWPWTGSGPVKVLTPEGGRNKLLKVQSLESGGGGGWRGARGAVAKSHSFGGYGDTRPHATHHAPQAPHARLLSRQGDLASSSWRLSPSSSGYKTLSLRSTDSVTPSPTGGASPEPTGPAVSVANSSSPAVDGVGGAGALVWAVTDMSAVPPGALVIHPQTGRPLTNPDGSVYHFDPANPPVLYDPNIYVHNEQKVDPNGRRGKLEKQHSFIDNECDCQPTEECRGKCCCDCRRHDACQRNTTDKIASSSEQKNSKPTSPCKNRYEQTNHTQEAIHETNQKQPETNHHSNYESPTNQRADYETLTNHKTTHESNPLEVSESLNAYDRAFEAQANQKQFENASTNQRVGNDVATNQRPAKLTSQDSQEMQYQTHYQGMRNDEVNSPGQPGHIHNHYTPDMVMQNLMAQAKVTPIPIQDPALRPVPGANVMYPTVPQGYHYVNPCRMEQPVQAIYQQVVPAEEQKQLAPSPHATESTFRIDPSYALANMAAVGAVELGPQCGACVDPNVHPHARSYNVPYGQVEVPAVLPPYLGNVVLPQPQPQLQPQPHLQPYTQYGEPLQWQTGGPLVPLGAPPKLLVPDLYPVLYPNLYPQYNLVYPQVIPQPYPVCQPVYPAAGSEQDGRRGSQAGGSQRHSKRNSVCGSSRHTPLPATPDDKHVPYRDNMHTNTQVPEKNLSRQNSNEIAAKIQQIKEQMAALNTGPGTKEREKFRPRDEWKRRNSGNGILGSYPLGGNRPVGTPGRPTPNDETQLSSAARAIVNTIRDMQAKNNYPDRRNHEYQNRRREFEPDRPDRPECPDRKPDTDDRRYDARSRNVNPVPFQYRPPYLLRQMSPGTWCRRSPGPVHPVLNHPRRPHPDPRNGRR
ncbi:uncharacterized protein LOC113517863 [Galleria mellonella]|uniref:Uncharacterized protein LOC113517863 n=1 Tax=Galleria mellonella TaxID=7137 RepID=A0ABM3MSW6_GALME|nr:uncharacterized protein LOC113517863 [Galleria mellonella]